MVADRRAAERESSAQRAALQARVQALREGVHALRTGKDASGTLLADPEKYPGVLGGAAALVSVDAGAQEAIAAALGGAADSVAVRGLDAAVAILEALKNEDVGSAGLMIASGSPGDAAIPADGGLPPGIRLPEGAQPALALVRSPDGLAPPWPACGRHRRGRRPDPGPGTGWRAPGAAGGHPAGRCPRRALGLGRLGPARQRVHPAQRGR